MSAALLVVLAAIGGALAHGAEGPTRTGFPGQVSAAGGTSGEVMARAGELRKVEDEAGTPGIPKGAGGNTAGPQPGASVRQSALGATGNGTQPSQASKALRAMPPASSPSQTYAEKEKSAQEAARIDLPQVEDRVAALWRGRHGAGEKGAVTTQAAPTTPRSEKLGTAPPSADVKQPKPGASGAAR